MGIEGLEPSRFIKSTDFSFTINFEEARVYFVEVSINGLIRDFLRIHLGVFKDCCSGGGLKCFLLEMH